MNASESVFYPLSQFIEVLSLLSEIFKYFLTKPEQNQHLPSRYKKKKKKKNDQKIDANLSLVQLPSTSIEIENPIHYLLFTLLTPLPFKPIQNPS